MQLILFKDVQLRLLKIDKILTRMKNVWIENGCIACGLSEKICPEVFQLKEHETLIQGVNFVEYMEKIKEAAKFCPVNVIKYSE